MTRSCLKFPLRVRQSMTELFSYCIFLAIFVVNLTDYESSGTGRGNTMCIGNETFKDFTNCVEENTRDYVKCSKPLCVRSNRIFKDSVVPVIQPLDGSIGFNETSQMSLAINVDVNTSYTILFYDKSFAFASTNPLVAPRAFFMLKPTSVFVILYLKVKVIPQVKLFSPIFTGCKKSKDEFEKKSLREITSLRFQFMY